MVVVVVVVVVVNDVCGWGGSGWGGLLQISIIKFIFYICTTSVNNLKCDC